MNTLNIIKDTIMKKLNLTLSFLILIGTQFSNAQSYQSGDSWFGGKMRKKVYKYSGNTYTLYDFSREGTTMRAKYFATNAYSQYLKWKGNKDILLVTAGAFSDGWEEGDKPVGLCVDNGNTINRYPDNEMDGMVIVYNGSTQIGGIAVVDLDKNEVKCEVPFKSKNYEYYNPRNGGTEATTFLNWGSSAGLTLFQTQLLYSEKKNSTENNFPRYGKPRERRFLAICKKGSTVHHVVVDAPSSEYLDSATDNAMKVLDEANFNVLYMLNLDTGHKNVLQAWNGSYLYDYRPSSHERAKISKATNLLIYYKI